MWLILKREGINLRKSVFLERVERKSACKKDELILRKWLKKGLGVCLLVSSELIVGSDGF